MAIQQLIEGSVEIAAPPEKVWALVSDLKRMSEWSPQVRKKFVLGRTVKEGTRTFNINGQGKLRWPTTAKVIAFEPNKKLAFKIVENRSIWTYELEPTATGTRLTESRTTPNGTTKFSDFSVDRGLGGAESFEESLSTGISTTLGRIKAAAEAA
jgi:uncharacterized protein YndB with AHSA1/START domain